MLFHTNNDDYIEYTNPVVPLIYIIRLNVIVVLVASTGKYNSMNFNFNSFEFVYNIIGMSIHPHMLRHSTEFKLANDALTKNNHLSDKYQKDKLFTIAAPIRAMMMNGSTYKLLLKALLIA